MRSGNDKDKGLYRKFRVERTDGSSQSGGKHQHCRYFVLDLDHDQYAAPALEAYAQACREEFPLLAADLLALTPPAAPVCPKCGHAPHAERRLCGAELPEDTHMGSHCMCEASPAAPTHSQQAERERDEAKVLVGEITRCDKCGGAGTNCCPLGHSKECKCAICQWYNWLRDRLMECSGSISNALLLPHGWTDLKAGIDLAYGKGKRW